MQTKEDKKRSGENRLNVRINPAWRQAFGLAAKARWTDATGLIHQFVKAVVDIERKTHPLIFKRFGDLDSIPLQDKDEQQEVPVEAPEDIRRIAYVAEIAATAQNLLKRSTSSGVTIEQAGEAIIQSLEAAAAKLFNEPGGLLDITAAERKEDERPLSRPTFTKPFRRPTSTVQSSARKGDEIDEWLDQARAFGGGPMPERDRQTIRAIIEKEHEELEKQSGKESE